MLRSLAAVWVIAVSAPSFAADETPLICFGNEPSWRVDLTTPGVAQYSTPDGEAVTFHGGVTRNDLLNESLWRGSPANGRDLVVFLRDAACSDQMSDTEHPVAVRVSTPDGRFLAGCCRIPAPTGAESASPALQGGSWRITDLPGTAAGGLDGLQRPVSVRFEAGRVSGFSGCNTFRGSYALQGDQLTLAQLASTQMACDEPGMSIENVFLAAFAGALHAEVDGDRLSLTAASGQVLTFEREGEPQLAGTSWKVTGFNNNRQAVIGPLAHTELTLTFDDTTVTGNAGCNTFRAPYSTQQGSITIGSPATTRRACEEDVMIQEQMFLAAVESSVTWRIDGNVLDVHRADGERTIHAIGGPR